MKRFEILTKEMLTPTICRMSVYAPLLAKAAQPGQFLMVRTDEKGERIPLTVSDYDREIGSVTIVTQQIGVSSGEIISREVGDCFADVVGPLGLPSEFVSMSSEEIKSQRYVFIAGGVGTAPVYPQAKWLHERGAAVDVIIGAKNADLLIYKKEMAGVCDNLFICTDDGSEGFHGMVTALLEKVVSAGLETTRRGCLVADSEGATTRPGVFAGGDAVTGAATVILAMGAGRTAARSIDEYIKNL